MVAENNLVKPLFEAIILIPSSLRWCQILLQAAHGKATAKRIAALT